MELLIIGLSTFFLVHLLPSTPTLRSTLVGKLGELPYKAVFSVISLIGFALIVWGKAEAEFIPVWQPPVMLAVVTKLMMLPAMVLLIAAYLPSNIKKHIRHPMLLGVFLWAVGHLLINGDMASILLFGGFLSFAVIDMASANARGAALQVDTKPLWNDVLVLILGGGAYALLGIFHQSLFGVPIV
ncbi:NnrU family protein [Alkalimarinus sediminis]|uniref:NnrU family protein n=1 Tax=Alkalimarinus sediminis TaxID=1632866 RepID=A0A9E8HRH2_9ALTE|nr:NnrU family protein [Alkalimarinus sediminis]UZW75131.1 NnrU family protein [Alkalimarinus sediminis]